MAWGHLPVQGLCFWDLLPVGPDSICFFFLKGVLNSSSGCPGGKVGGYHSSFPNPSALWANGNLFMGFFLDGLWGLRKGLCDPICGPRSSSFRDRLFCCPIAGARALCWVETMSERSLSPSTGPCVTPPPWVLQLFSQALIRHEGHLLAFQKVIWF